MTDAKEPTDKSFDSAGIAAKWWKQLNPDQGASRGILARLRRAKTPLEIIQEPAALDLIRRLPGENRDRVAILAGILAFVREDTANESVARTIGREKFDEKESAKMSESRFRRLLQSTDQDLLDAMRRLLRLTKGKAKIDDLSFAVLRWGDGVKKHWIFDYYNVAGLSESKTSGQPASTEATPPTG